MTQRRSRFQLSTRRPVRRASMEGRESAPEVSFESHRPAPAAPVEDSVVDSGLYREGRRVASPPTVAETARLLRDQPKSLAWLGLLRPADHQLLAVAEEFGLHEVAVEDAIVAHQRPKLEHYGDSVFVVLRAARYLDDVEEVDFGELHVFAGSNFVVTVRHSQSPDLAVVRRRMEGDSGLLAHGPMAILYAILDSVVDGYAPVVAGLQKDIDEIETEVFGGDPTVSRRIYELSREVIEFQRATQPLVPMLDALAGTLDTDRRDEELRRRLRDVADHATTVSERVHGFRVMLDDILTVNATLVNQAQNEEIKRLTEASFDQSEDVKRISAWAAILFAPTLIGTVYGMNFDSIPELHWEFGYPFAIALMLLTSLTLWVVFRARGWL